jgi:D-beta-D-heptose 7-phosphate kinase/D-beta-D-heptose 1-phosphate adenosyltransferase
MVVTVIGEICHDVFVYGDAKRLSPEAPVPVLTHTHVETNLGMAGNVRQNLWALEPKLRINLFHQKREIKKTRYVDDKSNHMFLRVDEGEDIIDTFNLNISKTNAIKNSDIIIVSDYNKGFLDEETLINIGKNSKLSIIDTKKKLTKEIVNSFTFVKLNEHEYNTNEKITNSNKEKFIITLGMKGARHNNTDYPSPSPKQTMDVSGAGDTFTASFILKYKETGDIDKSIVFANLMSSIVVSKRGVTTP